MQPVLFVMYLVQYMPTIGYWFMDQVSSFTHLDFKYAITFTFSSLVLLFTLCPIIGANRLDAAASKRSAYSWSLLFGHKKSA
ncbi:hypothetical protein B296_00025306 [Ensete ventricosum]|uniref:Uncharacterized protein n=1 Tax=Ensete ventricosum TaxID=4639 RepID=A0A427A885_ENSVE|nr:hypothetical protein B296_00025306 [Ensete ventricosum]